MKIVHRLDIVRRHALFLHLFPVVGHVVIYAPYLLYQLLALDLFDLFYGCCLDLLLKIMFCQSKVPAFRNKIMLRDCLVDCIKSTQLFAHPAADAEGLIHNRRLFHREGGAAYLHAGLARAALFGIH